jgi:hypothetical protein
VFLSSGSGVVGHQFFEEVLLFDCAFMIAKNYCLIDVLYSVLFIKGLKGPLLSVCENLLH